MPQETFVSAPQASVPDALFTNVYAQLKAMASRQLARRSSGATLNTTALVHEVYLKISASHELQFDAPVQFFDYAAQAMRHILIDRAREHLALKRGGDAINVELDSRIPTDDTGRRTLELDEALQRLEREDPRAARLVSLHYFAGMSLPEIAKLIGLAPRTLNRDWRFARAFLRDQLE